MRIHTSSTPLACHNLQKMGTVRFEVAQHGPGGCASMRRLLASKTRKAGLLARAIMGRQTVRAGGAAHRARGRYSRHNLLTIQDGKCTHKAADVFIYAAARMMANDGFILVRRGIVLGTDVRHDRDTVNTTRDNSPLVSGVGQTLDNASHCQCIYMPTPSRTGTRIDFSARQRASNFSLRRAWP